MVIGVSGKIGSGKDAIGKIIQGLTSSNITEGEIIEIVEDRLLRFNTTWEIKKYAYKLKQIVSLLTGCTVEDLENQGFKQYKLGDDWDYRTNWDGHKLTPVMVTEEDRNFLGVDRIKTYSYRELLQKIGTEAMRDCIHQNIWVNALFADYKPTIYRSEVSVRTAGYIDTEVYPNWIITDTRFPNEAKAIKDRNGIVIRVNRKSFKWIDADDYENFTGKKVERIPEHPSETALDDYQFDYVIDNNGTIEELIEKVRKILQKERII